MKLIALSASTTENRTFVNTAYHRAFTRDGVLPVTLPQFIVPNREVITQDEYYAQHQGQFEAYADQLSALCLTGGVDLNPVTFDDTNWGSMSCDGERDMMELGLMRAFIEAGKPILGICRGHQLGGSFLGLNNFLQDLTVTKELHQSAERELKDRQEHVHSTYVFGGLRDYLRTQTGRANLTSIRQCSHHHQGYVLESDGKIPKHIKTAAQYSNWFSGAIAAYEEANDIKVLASTTMVIEGIEKEEARYVSYQAHPEETGPDSLLIGYWLSKYVLSQPAA